MSTQSESKLNILIEGNASGALAVMDEVSKAISNMAKSMSDIGKVTGDIGKLVSDMTSTMARDFVSASKEMGGLDTSFGSLSKIVEDTGKVISDELSSIDKSIDEMSKTMDAGMSQMIGEMKALVSETRGVTTAVTDMGVKSQVAGEKLSKSIDYAGLLIAGEQLKQFGEKVVGFFAESVKAGADFSQTMANTKAALDSQPGAISATNAQMQTMQNLFLQLGSTGFQSANAVAEAASTLAKNGLKFNAITQGAIQQTAAVASANQQDIDETATTISDIYNELGSNIVKQFGGNVTQAFGYISDVMTRTLHSSKISMTDFFNTMKMVGSTASNAGLSFSDLGSAISLLGSHAIRGTQAGTSLRRLLTNLTPTTKAATDMMKQLNMIAASGSNIFYDSTGHMKSMADVQQILHDKLGALSPQMQTFAEKTLFGQYSLAAMSTLVNESPAAFAKLSASMNTAGATMTALKDREQGWAYTWMKLKAEFATIQKEIGLQLKPAVDKLTNALARLMNWWDHLSNGTKNFIVYGAGVVGVLALVGGTMMTMVASLGFLVSGLAAAGTAFAAIGSFALPVVAVLAVVGVAVYELVKHWNTVKSVTETVWADVERVTTTVVRSIMSVVNPAIQAVSTWWKSHFDEIRTVSETVFRVFRSLVEIYFLPEITMIKVTLGVLQKTWKDIWFLIRDVLKGVFDIIVTTVRVSWSLLSGIIGIGLDLLTGKWSKSWSDLKKMVTDIWTAMRDGVGKIAQDMGNVVMDAVHTLVDGVTGAFNGLLNTARTIWNGVISIFGQKVPTPQMPSVPSAASATSAALSKINHYATGGIATKPQIAMIAENGPEAVIPMNLINSQGTKTSLPGGLARGGAMGRNNVTINGGININVPNGDASQISRQIKIQLQRALG